MRRTLTTFALLSVAALCAHADDSRLLTSATLADLRAIVTEEGYTILSTGDDGAYSVRARTADGLIFNLVGAACDTEYADGCLGISMQVRYDADGEETLERINEVNLMWAATAAWYSSGGTDGKTPTVGITRYVILDRGATVGNIKDNLLNVLAIAPKAANYIWQVDDYDDEEDYYYGDW
ncbi:MAG: YbjN domain-containing protein [Hyphomonas sp.]